MVKFIYLAVYALYRFLIISLIADTAHVVFAKWQELSLSRVMKNL